MADRVVVFLDYQNVYSCARQAFHEFHERSGPSTSGHIDPVRLAEHLVADGPFCRGLHQIRIYRGLPSQKHNHRGYAACRRQHAAWLRDPRVYLATRPLRYPRGYPNCDERPQEKGVDVALSTDFAVMGILGEYDVGIMFSMDTDLLPALEIVAERGPARAEVAAWSAGRRGASRLSITSRNLYCHWLSREVYLRVHDPTNYAKPTGGAKR